MPSYKVKVKWGKEMFNDVEVNTDEEPIVFKAQLFAITGVPPDRQKVMIKGTTLKDEAWGTIKIKDGASILLMGTKEELPPEPVEKTVFMEDMSDHELATALELPPGLTNLGNTCYMNATVQCLKTVPELRAALKKFTGGSPSSHSAIAPAQALTAVLSDLYEAMDKCGTEFLPFIFLQVLHMAVPRFAEKNEHGVYLQQDANECWTEVMRMLQQKLPSVPNEILSDQASVSKYTSFIDQYFGGSLDSTLKCIESEDEPESHLKENFLQLSCFISADVKFMLTGLKQRMQETITKFSSTLNRDAQYKKMSKISRLPAYLTIQFVRFYYKEKESINAKVLKDVKFSLDLDVFELCSEELQAKLTPMRAKFKEIEDKKVEEAQKAKLAPQEPPQKIDKQMKRMPYHFEDDIGSNNSGYYELNAVLTHKGRSSSSGHYVAWIKRKADEWFKCDDDTVTMVTSEEILKLSGGGDWHCAYLLLYAPRVLEIEESSSEMTS
ncbi:ubiquitin carboxyl-terminal hydrolase 14-like isoform X2 [Uloborus diversus]|uniref:ubiquitin carboxyl-terminal hydrolase 14-like isoform X2 n=1 Tax=Uloborus diversus TaxID=327109 RepID=UPI002409E6FE|nr:ubiquitin carboxyl-terminal hydrolase 14-like isoform X2 [Uloborus diversus]